MRFPCEINVKHIIPAVRAIMVKELHMKYGKNQVEIAKLLGLTQPSVSHYLRGERGGRGIDLIQESKIYNKVLALAEELARSNMTNSKLIKTICSICTEVRPVFIKTYYSGMDPSSFEECDELSNCL